MTLIPLSWKALIDKLLARALEKGRKSVSGFYTSKVGKDKEYMIQVEDNTEDNGYFL